MNVKWNNWLLLNFVKELYYTYITAKRNNKTFLFFKVFLNAEQWNISNLEELHNQLFVENDAWIFVAMQRNVIKIHTYIHNSNSNVNMRRSHALITSIFMSIPWVRKHFPSLNPCSKTGYFTSSPFSTGIFNFIWCFLSFSELISWVLKLFSCDRGLFSSGADSSYYSANVISNSWARFVFYLRSVLIQFIWNARWYSNNAYHLLYIFREANLKDFSLLCPDVALSE